MVRSIAEEEYDKAWKEILNKIPISLESHQRMIIYCNCRVEQNMSHEDALEKALTSTELPSVIFGIADD